MEKEQHSWKSARPEPAHPLAGLGSEFSGGLLFREIQSNTDLPKEKFEEKQPDPAIVTVVLDATK